MSVLAADAPRRSAKGPRRPAARRPLGGPTIADALIPGALAAGPVCRHSKAVFAYGNYDPHYASRYDLTASMDLRIEALMMHYGQDVFCGRSVLDLGCNTGFNVFLMAMLGAKNAEGVDLDLTLISKALRHLRRLKSKGSAPQAESLRAPAAVIQCSGIIPYISKPLASHPAMLPQPDGSRFPQNVEFRSANVIASDIEERRGSTYDMVLCLKLTKWVHLHWGDAGIKTLFSRCYRLLNPGGLLVLEAQEWSSYQSRGHLTSQSKRQTAKQFLEVLSDELKLKPHDFTAYLVDVVGFEAPTSLGQCPPLKRPLLLFRRPGPAVFVAVNLDTGRRGRIRNHVQGDDLERQQPDRHDAHTRGDSDCPQFDDECSMHISASKQQRL